MACHIQTHIQYDPGLGVFVCIMFGVEVGATQILVFRRAVDGLEHR